MVLAEWVLVSEGYPPDTELSIRAVTDEEIADLKRRWFAVDAPTDVLSFPIDEHTAGVAPRPEPGGPPVLLGDVVIAPAFIARQAADYGVSEADELSLMVVHGVLHLMGWGHETEDEAEAMESRERELLAQAGVNRR